MLFEVIKSIPNIVKDKFSVAVYNHTSGLIDVFHVLKEKIRSVIYLVGIIVIPSAVMHLNLNEIAVLSYLSFVGVDSLIQCRCFFVNIHTTLFDNLGKMSINTTYQLR